jgi:hypothetical protein
MQYQTRTVLLNNTPVEWQRMSKQGDLVRILGSLSDPPQDENRVGDISVSKGNVAHGQTTQYVVLCTAAGTFAERYQLSR